MCRLPPFLPRRHWTLLPLIIIIIIISIMSTIRGTVSFSLRHRAWWRIHQSPPLTPLGRNMHLPPQPQRFFITTSTHHRRALGGSSHLVIWKIQPQPNERKLNLDRYFSSDNVTTRATPSSTASTLLHGSTTLQFHNVLIVIKQTAYEEYSQVGCHC